MGFFNRKKKEEPQNVVSMASIPEPPNMQEEMNKPSPVQRDSFSGEKIEKKFGKPFMFVMTFNVDSPDKVQDLINMKQEWEEETGDDVRLEIENYDDDD